MKFLRTYVVYQTSDGHFGYRSIGELSHQYREQSANMLMSSMVNLGEAVQCWMIDAYGGSNAISRVRKLLKLKAVK